MQTKEKFKKEIIKKIELDYLMYLPENYNEIKKWPLMLFLHGAGERGEDIEKVKRHGPPKLIEEGKDFPFIIISPQCPESSWWAFETFNLNELLNDIKSKYSIDNASIYLTGLSMGGYGTWDMAIDFPDLFAALIPICGGVRNNKGLEKLTHIPVWVFHGEKDQTVLFKFSQDAVDKLTALGGNVKFTAYPEAEHDSWTETYENPEVYKWMLAQVKDSK